MPVLAALISGCRSGERECLFFAILLNVPSTFTAVVASCFWPRSATLLMLLPAAVPRPYLVARLACHLTGRL